MQPLDQFRLSLKSFMRAKPVIADDCWPVCFLLELLEPPIDHFVLAPVLSSPAGCNEGFEISLHGGERRVYENSHSGQP